MPAHALDRDYFEAGLRELSGYLLSNELYWPLSSGRSDLPRLTVGGLLVCRLRLRARSAPGEERAQFERLEAQLDETRSRWRSAWDARVARESRARLDLWRNSLADLIRLPDGNAGLYRHEVQWRVMIHLLADEVALPPAEAEALAGLDQILEAHFRPGGFIWDAGLADVFPAAPFWYLYGMLQPVEERS
jgi:hypothetical protein